jgi:hypothetical protein
VTGHQLASDGVTARVVVTAIIVMVIWGDKARDFIVLMRTSLCAPHVTKAALTAG